MNFQCSSWMLDDGIKFIGISEVFYKNNLLTNWFVGIASSLPMQAEALSIELSKVIFTTKNPKWKYEKEARIISHNPGLLKIRETFIKQICFGLNTSDEDIELIREITNSYKEKVQLCRIIRSKTDFGIAVKKI
jgi:hypothetical protein